MRMRATKTSKERERVPGGESTKRREFFKEGNQKGSIRRQDFYIKTKGPTQKEGLIQGGGKNLRQIKKTRRTWRTV